MHFRDDWGAGYLQKVDYEGNEIQILTDINFIYRKSSYNYDTEGYDILRSQSYSGHDIQYDKDADYVYLILGNKYDATLEKQP